MVTQELIMVCVDNSLSTKHFASQIDAIHVYCHAKLKSNPKTAVGIVAMAVDGLAPFGRLLPPTSDLAEIMDCVQGILCSGKSNFIKGIACAQMYLELAEPNVQKRMLIITGGPANLHLDHAKGCGNNFKNLGIAVDLVNLCPEVDHKPKRLALNAFVAAVNNNQNSHIKHLIAGCPIRDLLSSPPAIITPEEIAAAADLKMPPRLPRKPKVVEGYDMKQFLEALRKGKSQAVAGKCAPLGVVNRI